MNVWTVGFTGSLKDKQSELMKDMFENRVSDFLQFLCCAICTKSIIASKFTQSAEAVLAADFKANSQTPDPGWGVGKIGCLRSLETCWIALGLIWVHVPSIQFQ